MHFKITFAYRAVLIAAALSVTACSPDNAAGGGAGTTAQITPNNAAVEDQAEPEEAANLTAPQKNAVRSAKQYLSMSGFSRNGLIQQLSSSAGDSYNEADATAAVDSLDVDWNGNAVKSAKQYLSISGFSCQGLIEQLSSSAGDKYTVSQATYGAQQAGACA
ncbi:MAG: Ltp family lipoprotein [Caulobacteraceae bacterium]